MTYSIDNTTSCWYCEHLLNFNFINNKQLLKPGMSGIATEKNVNMVIEDQQVKQGNLGPLTMVTMLFFMWGFITCLNDILIPKLKEVFVLMHWQAMLIQTAFFGAYFIISFIYFIISITKGDFISRIGYKNGIITGLAISAFGCLLFYPAADFQSYALFLAALFVLASGITILQIAANPYVAVLGSPEGASSRLNLTQAFNSLGTTIAPLVGGYLIFEAASAADGSAGSVKVPYLALSALLLLIALMLKLVYLPKVNAGGDAKIQSGSGALKHRHLVLGAVCIFAYVGGEVTVGSALIGFIGLPNVAGFDEAVASQYLAFFWGGAMVGRFFGAVALGQFKRQYYKYLIIGLITIVAFTTVYSIYGLQSAVITLLMIGLNILVLFLGRFIPNRTLGLFAVSVVGLLFITLLGQGHLAMWSAIAIGLFNSIMFPTIFALAIKGLGQLTSQGSSLLVMAIVGGAIVPPLQGFVADMTANLQFSFIVPLLCYVFIAYYGFIGYKQENENIQM